MAIILEAAVAEDEDRQQPIAKRGLSTIPDLLAALQPPAWLPPPQDDRNLVSQDGIDVWRAAFEQAVDELTLLSGQQPKLWSSREHDEALVFALSRWLPAEAAEDQEGWILDRRVRTKLSGQRHMSLFSLQLPKLTSLPQCTRQLCSTSSHRRTFCRSSLSFSRRRRRNSRRRRFERCQSRFTTMTSRSFPSCGGRRPAGAAGTSSVLLWMALTSVMPSLSIVSVHKRAHDASGSACRTRHRAEPWPRALTQPPDRRPPRCRFQSFYRPS